MNKLASQTIDFHDNKKLIAELGELPDFVKKADFKEASEIPNEKWAVIMLTDAGVMSKFALHNKAHVWMSSRIFPKTAHQLPLQAQQVAAQHIKRACLEYRIDYDSEIDRLANCTKQAESNMLDMVGTPETSKLDYNQYKVGWRGEATKDAIQKKLETFAFKDPKTTGFMSEQEMGEELAGKLYSWAMNEGYSLPSADSIASMLTSLAPEGLKDKKAIKSFFVDKMNAIDSEQKTKRASLEVRRLNYEEDSFGVKIAADNTHTGYFPMNTPELVKRAQEYYLDHLEMLAPKFRREFAIGIVKNASAHGLMVEDERILKYANESYSKHLQGNVEARKSFLKGEEAHVKEASSTLDKLLGMRRLMSPERFAGALEVFDKRAGIDAYWDSHIKDPYLSTFEHTKQASWSYRMHDTVINEKQLRDFAEKHVESLNGYLNQYIIEDLRKMPIEIFDSLPTPEKEIIVSKMEEAGVA